MLSKVLIKYFFLIFLGNCGSCGYSQLLYVQPAVNKENYQSEDMGSSCSNIENYKYDHIFISLGECCKVAWFIRDTGLNSYSYPFDWLLSSCDAVCDLIETDFTLFFKLENLKNLYDYCRNTDTNASLGTIKVIDQLYDIESRHDFSFNIPIENQYDQVYQKYQRRISRLYRALNQTQRKVYLVRKRITKEQAVRLSSIISLKFPHLDFTLIALDDRKEAAQNWNLLHVRNFYFDNPTFRYDEATKKNIYDPTVRFDLWDKILKEVLDR